MTVKEFKKKKVALLEHSLQAVQSVGKHLPNCLLPLR